MTVAIAHKHWLVRGLRFLGWLLVMLVVAVALWAAWAFAARPNYAGTISHPRLTAPVDILRDPNGVAHVFAQTIDDAAFGVAVAQAEDRGWQLEILRAAARGETAELIGSARLSADLIHHAMGYARVGALTQPRYDAATRATLQAFADGMNAAIADGRYQRSPEFRLLRHKPKPWTVGDVGAVLFVITETAQDQNEEALRALVTNKIGASQADTLFPAMPDSFPSLYRDIANAGPAAQASPQKASSAVAADKAGTNFFLFGPAKTRTGKPLFAIDPHLPLDTPGLIYPVTINLPDETIRGGAWVGTPAVAFGHNRQIAWGMTHLPADTADLVVERIDPANPRNYLTADGSRAFAVRSLTVKAKGGKSLTQSVRSTAHGTVISDVSPSMKTLADSYGPGHVIVRKQVNLQIGALTVQSLLKMNRATDWQSFRAAAADYEWQNNIAYADRAGNVGVQSAARIPLRSGAWDGSRPALGWLGEGKWDGIAAFDTMPRAFNPPRGYILDANSRIVDERFPFRISTYWTQPWRIIRAEAIASKLQRVGPEDLRKMQLDVYSARAAYVLEAALPLAAPADADERWLVANLRAWDRHMASDKVAPLVYVIFERALNRRLFADKLGPAAEPAIGSGNPDGLRIVAALTQHRNWCDDVRKTGVQDCRAAVNDAIRDAASTLRHSYKNLDQVPPWGKVHAARFPHFYLFDRIPLLGGLTAIEVDHGGGEGTLNAGGTNYASKMPFQQRGGAVYRQIVDLANLDASQFSWAPGVSGVFGSPYYGNMAARWAKGEYVSLAWSREQLIRRKSKRLILTPAQSGNMR